MKLLDQFLDEAYFVLELIGVTVFIKDSSKKKYSVLPPIPSKTDEEKELWVKSETFAFLKEQGIIVDRKASYAKLQEKKKSFWINPKTEFLKENWTIVLNNQVTKTLYVLKVPKNSFVCSLKNDGHSLVVRKDKPYYIDLNIDCISFIDTRSKLSFVDYIVHTIKY